MAKQLTSRLCILVLLLLLVGCDHATKGVAKAELEGGAALDLLGGLLSFRYVENTDIAFSLLRWIPETIRFPGLLVVGAFAVIGSAVLLFKLRSKEGLLVGAFLLVTAGAIGNYLDRVFRGYVVDFVALPHWPVFNVADVYLVLGYVLLGWTLLVVRRRGEATEQASG